MLFLLVAINVAVVGAEFAFLSKELARKNEETAREHANNLVSTVRGQVLPEGDLNVARILQWPSWGQYADAIILSTWQGAPAIGGDARPGRLERIVPGGVALNPKGSSSRPADFDLQGVYTAILLSIERRQAIDDVEGGRVVPIDHPSGTWGACWYRIDTNTSPSELFVRFFLPIFLFSTVLLSGGTFIALRRFVLDPVERLARAARQVAEGDLSVRLRPGPSGDELSELMRSFDGMTDEVQGFNERLAREVRLATEQARSAEAAAMTQRRLAAMGELAAGIAHEINNPLGGLLNAVETLSQERLGPEKRKQYLELLHGGLERIRLTVGQLLRFTPRQARTGPVQLSLPLKDAVALVRHRAARQGVAIRLSEGVHTGTPEKLSDELERSFAELPPIEGEAHELAQALLNLLVNALDALEALPHGSGAIDVVLARSQGELVLEVRDNGPGMSADSLARASDLYFTTKEVGKGTGLGLAIVHRVAASHGGTLELSSSPGAGFRAVLRLPIERAIRGSDGGARSPEGAPPAP